MYQMLCLLSTQSTIKKYAHIILFLLDKMCIQPQVSPNQLHRWLSGRGVPRRLAGLDTARFLEIVATKPARIFLIAVPADAGRIETLQTAASATGDSVEGWLRDIIEGIITR